MGLLGVWGGACAYSSGGIEWWAVRWNTREYTDTYRADTYQGGELLPFLGRSIGKGLQHLVGDEDVGEEEPRCDLGSVLELVLQASVQV